MKAIQLSKVSAACTLAFAAMSGVVQAQTPAPFAAPNFQVNMSGATAPDNFIGSIATGLFNAGFHTYHDDNGTPTIFTDDGRGWRAFFGRVQNVTTIPLAIRNQDVMFIKRSAGGSVWGVNPVARASRHRVIDINATSCVLNTGIYRCPIKGTDPGQAGYLNAGNTGIPSDFGVSDVEPAMFKSPLNVEFGETQLSIAEASAIPPQAVNVLMMGIVATAAVSPSTTITRAQYGAMLSNQITDWSQVDVNLNTTGYTNVVVCRRVQGSGTQTSYNWYFNNFPCQNQFAGVIAPARMETESFSGIVAGNGTQTDPFQIDPTAGYTVVENSGSGNVRDCLVRAQTNAVHTFRGDNGSFYSIRFDWGRTTSLPADIGNAANASQGAFRAIGTLSLDSFNATSSPMDPTGVTNWSYRYMDGAGIFNPTTQLNGPGPGTGTAPSKANLLTGAYDFAVELTMQYRTQQVTNDHGDVIAALTVPANALKKTFADEFIKRSRDPAFNTIPATAALPPAFTPTFLAGSNVPNNNVARGTRSGNTCSPLQILF